MQKNLVKIEPNNLSIIISKDNENKTPYNFTIENLTNKYLIYQSLSNTKGIIFAKPAISYILPNKNISIELNLTKSNMPLDEYKKTKLLLMFFPYDEEINTVEQAKNILERLKKQKNNFQKMFLNLNFIIEEIIDTDTVKFDEIKKDDNFNNNNEKIIFVNYTNTRKQLISKNEEIIKNLETNKKRLEDLMENNRSKKEKNKFKGKSKYNFDNLIMISIILFGLIIGSNFAIGYKKLFNK